MWTSANALTLGEDFAFATLFVRYAINGHKYLNKNVMPVILWLADRLLRVMAEEEESMVVENADLQGT